MDRIAPAERLRKGEEAPSIDCLAKLGDEVIVGLSDGTIRRLGFRPNGYGDLVGRCEDGVTSLLAVPREDGWVVSASGTKVNFWDVKAERDGEEDEESEDEESEDEKPNKRRKTKPRNQPEGGQHAVFDDLD